MNTPNNAALSSVTVISGWYWMGLTDADRPMCKTDLSEVAYSLGVEDAELGISTREGIKLINEVEKRLAVFASPTVKNNAPAKRCCVCGRQAEMAASLGLACADHYDELSE